MPHEDHLGVDDTMTTGEGAVGRAAATSDREEPSADRSACQADGTGDRERRGTTLPPRAVWRLMGAVALIGALDELPPRNDHDPRPGPWGLPDATAREPATGGHVVRR